MRILIVEDETRLAETLRQLLEDQRYQVDTVYDGADGVDYGLAGQYDLIILDVMLPKVDGFQVAQRLRAAHVSTPILMLTARDDVSDKISGLDCGADDYMTKPVNYEELTWRINALLRRSRIASEQKIVVGRVVLDSGTYTVQREGETLELPRKEFELLYKLLSYPGQIFTRNQLLDGVWGYDSESGEDTVKTHISRLRNKLRDIPEFRIVTIKGLGYKAEITKEEQP